MACRGITWIACGSDLKTHYLPARMTLALVTVIEMYLRSV